MNSERACIFTGMRCLLEVWATPTQPISSQFYFGKNYFLNTAQRGRSSAEQCIRKLGFWLLFCRWLLAILGESGGGSYLSFPRSERRGAVVPVTLPLGFVVRISEVTLRCCDHKNFHIWYILVITICLMLTFLFMTDLSQWYHSPHVHWSWGRDLWSLICVLGWMKDMVLTWLLLIQVFLITAYVPEVCLLKHKRTGFEAQPRHFMLNTLE